ncbi:aldehyde dehydrogenase family protein [Streptomyces alfalfae]|uniref:Aldehyde dehydrogenase n=1 Tax=Streptomyces alfalfae TaxID=1642299 RepID=A0A1P8TPS9_9ACTN|nr:aldehyde dehydrogenase family protein [Streptomyces alfalfae]AYA20104.1 aldehyde dehydrogenase family protein [Streptomyces fradiae]APY89658.1 aldehyde dehydrogenase [Streptomyces alfalfae]QQC87868.1 aldehyde dehydrogenase family protein [Streptomyces alfalfae]RXX43595.1 aldehyde dehydrogenase family protein [Streptomyces alfalfae]RZN01429.1 aldehyde dehydrogenase family protein [Streptomyces alfalfae]
MSTTATPAQGTEDIPALVARLRAAFATGRTRPLAWREEQLTRLRALLTENRDAITDALYSDLRKPRPEASAAEVDFPVREIDHTLANLRVWLEPQSLDQAALAGLPAGTTAGTLYEPLGTVLVIAPWNYPVQLSLVPVAGALAAGNAVVLKPSEVAPATSALMARLLPRYLDPEAVAVVEGDVPRTTELLAQRFDHIFYTGNGTVGRIVMRAAAEHLTPVTLELGGKSPVFVDRDTDVTAVAARLADTKFRNSGQTCVAPDYVLTDPATARALESALAEAVEKLFGPDPQSSAAYGRMVNQRHFDRVAALLDSGTTAFGGQTDRDDVYIAPTVLTGVTGDDPVMREEIFGPVLPIVEVADLDEAIAFINDRDKPLALYGFTGNDTTRHRLATETSSGGLGFGLPMAHLRVPELPFGGVGESGMGNYHGPHSLATFSHRRARLDVPLG